MKHKSILFLLIISLAVLVLAGCSAKQNNEQAMPEPSYEVLETVPPTAPPVEVVMPEYEFTYSGELKDIIVLKTLDDGSGIEFTVVLSNGEEHIYTLHYNSTDGDLVEVMTNAKGERVPVAFQMADIPEGLSGNDETIFYTAQESVNEIVASLILK